MFLSAWVQRTQRPGQTRRIVGDSCLDMTAINSHQNLNHVNDVGGCQRESYKSCKSHLKRYPLLTAL
jgi:hypothetical protein